MFELAFVVATVAYTFVAIQVDSWITISALGFKIETPVFFLTHPRVYDVVRSVLFLLVLGLCFLTRIPWYVSVASLAFLWLYTGWIGRKNGFKLYRKVLREMEDKAETDAERKEYERAASRTDQELLDEVQQSMKINYLASRGKWF